MKIDIPGYNKNEFQNLVLDFNGTLAIDGKVLDGVKERMTELSKVLDIYVITGDTYGTVRGLLKDYPCKVYIIPQTDQANEKVKQLEKLNYNKTIAVGNGRNDQLMLKRAGLGIGLIQQEGLCTETLKKSDLLFTNILDLFDTLLKPNRLKASLRD